MFLRKYLNGARIISVSQPQFERVLEIGLQKGAESYFLIVELFSKGNVIICDKDKKILVPLRAQEWKDRVIKPRQQYLLPQKTLDLSALDFPRFKELISSSTKDQLVKALAIELGIGGTYAEELCLKSDVDKVKSPDAATDQELRLLLKNFEDLLDLAAHGNIKAYIVYENSTAIDVQPFELQLYKGLRKEPYETFGSAVDVFFVKNITEKQTASNLRLIETEIEKQRMLLEQHKQYLEENLAKAKQERAKADLIYADLDKLRSMTDAIKEARENKTPWPEIMARIDQAKKEGNESAKLVKSIDPATSIMTLESGIAIDLKEGLMQSANAMYEQAKKLEAKAGGISAAINEVEQKIDSLESKKKTAPAMAMAAAPKKMTKKEKEWFQKFVWMHTSSGKLVIAGKDATQNEVLVKRYLEDSDIVFHADVHGSPFTILKGGKDSTEEDKLEAAQLTLCHSRAWQSKMPSEVYWAHPHQVSKKAPAGEYIAKGGFMIYGKKNYVKNLELKYAVGLQLEPQQVISGPVENVRKKARYYAVILPGEEDKDQLAKDIKEFLLSVARPEDRELINRLDTEEIKEHALNKSKVFGLVK
jgi:predicted ribosome quality control (RQC) complex YloA/Tae2 family protein